MALKLVVGGNNTGKSKYIYMDALESKNALIFVPSQSRMSAEEEYLSITNTEAMLYTEIYTLSNYISKCLKKNDMYSHSKYLSDDAKRLAIKKIVSEEKDIFKVFAKVKDRSSFIDMVISYIDLLKRQNISLEELKNIDIPNNLTKAKLDELEKIYNSICEKTKDIYVDSLDEMDLFIKRLEKDADIFKGKKVYFHGYNNFSKKELGIIKSMLKNDMDITISLTIPKEIIDNYNNAGNGFDMVSNGIFEIACMTYKELLEIAYEIRGKADVLLLDKNISRASDDIKYLAENIFNTDAELYKGNIKGISIVLEKNMNTEIENIARDMVRLVRENNENRWKDFCVDTNDFDTYEFAIRRIFNEYNIPYHFDKKYSIKNSSIVQYILLLFKILVNESNIEDYIMLLKTRLLDIDRLDICYFENYIIEFGIKEYMMKKDFFKNNKEEQYGSIVYDLNKINSIRKNITENITSVKERVVSCNTPKEYVDIIYQYLEENNVVLNYQSEIDIVSKQDDTIGKLKEEVISKIYEVLENICFLQESLNYNISFKEFTELFNYGIESIEISTIPMHLDEVEICDINTSRRADKKYCYLIGAYEGGLPKPMEEDSIFSDNELDEIKEQGIELKQNSITRMNMALFNIYNCFEKCVKNLRISVPTAKMTGEILRTSTLISSITRIIEVDVKSNILDGDNDNLSKKYEIEKTDKVAFREMLEAMTNCENLDQSELDYVYSLYNHFSKNKEYNKIMEYNRNDNNLSKEVLDMIYSDKITSSVSKMESFKKCPFSYFVNYVIKLKPRKEYKMSVMDMGTLMHEVLDKFSRYILERNISWQEIISDEMVRKKSKEKINSIIDDIFDKTYYKYIDSFKYIMLKEKLKKSMYKIILNIARSFNQSEFKPLGYEIEFKEGSVFAPIEIVIDVGKNETKTMYLVGKIDRVDMAEIGDNVYLRIVDYKSSSKSLKLEDIKEGISLQLMSYMSAIISNKEKVSKDREVIPAALNYYTLKANIKKLSNYEDDEAVISKKIMEDLKLKGIYLSDVKVLESLDSKYKDSKSSYLDINSRNISDENKVLSKEKFEEECKNVKRVLKDIGKEIVSGNVKIQPRVVNGKMPCEYCEFLSMCRKNCRV